MKRLPMAWTRGVLLALAAVLLSACDGVGDGNKPESATLVKLGNPISATKVYTCFSESLQMRVIFSNGDAGRFEHRAKWTSSNPEVLYVSSVGDPVPAALLGPGEGDGQVFRIGGILFPLKAGSATITAAGAGLTASIAIEVKDPTDLKVRAVGYNDADATSVFLGPNTQQSLQLLAKLDGFTFDATNSLNITWEFSPSDTNVASFITDSSGNATSFIQTTANSGGPLRARPVLRGCSNSSGVLSGVGIDVSVAPIKGLTLKHELENPKNVDETGRTTMALDTTEILQLYGLFDTDGDTGTAHVAGQNLSTQVLADSTDEGVLLHGIFGRPTAVLALSTGGPAEAPKTVSDPQTVTFCVPKPLAANETTRACSDDVALSLTTDAFVTRTDALQSFTVASSTGRNEVPAFGNLQLRAEGTFASGLVQDITRKVTWSSSDAATIAVDSSGVAQSLILKRDANGEIAADQGEATITATNNTAASGTSQTLNLTVVLP